MTIIDTIFIYFESIYVIIFWGWPFMLLVWLFILKMMWKGWPVDVVIIEKRGENLIKTNDRAGKYVDPYTGMTGYKLRKSKDTVPIVNYEWVLHCVPVHTTFFDRLVNIIRPTIGTMFFFRYGSKQYKPIQVNQNEKNKLVYQEIKDKSGNPIYINVYQQFDPRHKMGALDFDIIDWDNMNFMVQEQRASFVRRQKKGEWIKQIAIPLGLAIVVALVCIIMIKFSYDWAVGMRGQAGASVPSSGEATSPNIPIIGDLVPGA